MKKLIEKLKMFTKRLETQELDSRKVVELKSPGLRFIVSFGKIHGNYTDVHITYPNGHDRYETLAEGDIIVLDPIIDLYSLLKYEEGTPTGIELRDNKTQALNRAVMEGETK